MPIYRYIECTLSRGMFSAERLVTFTINSAEMQLFVNVDDVIVRAGQSALLRVQLVDSDYIKLPGVGFDTLYPRPVRIEDPSQLHNVHNVAD